MIEHLGTTATVTGNTVTGAGATPLIAQNGIQVSDDASATVSGNECDHPTWGSDFVNCYQSIGILLFAPAAGTTVSGNTVTGNGLGIYDYAVGATTLSGNTVGTSCYEGIVLDRATRR